MDDWYPDEDDDPEEYYDPVDDLMLFEACDGNFWAEMYMASKIIDHIYIPSKKAILIFSIFFLIGFFFLCLFSTM